MTNRLSDVNRTNYAQGLPTGVKFSLPTDFSMEAVRPLKTVCDKIGSWISAELIMHKVYPLGQSTVFHFQ